MQLTATLSHWILTPLISSAPTSVALSARWLALFLVFSGIGASLRLWRGGGRYRELAWLDFWLGWAMVTALLQMWHFWSPVDERAVIAIAVLAIPGIAGRLAETRRSFRIDRAVVLTALILVVATLWVGIVAAGPVFNRDTGSYHLQSTMWTSSLPIVPGLGNLHDRLAFNSGFHLYAALLEALPGEIPSYYLANGLIWLVLLAQVIWLAIKPPPSAWGRIQRLFLLFALTPLFRQAMTSQFTGLSPDFSIFAVQLVTAIAMFAVLDNDARTARPRFDLFAVMALSSFAVTIKLSSAAPSAVAIAVCVFSALAGPSPESRRRGFRAGVAGAVAAVILIVPWMARGIVLSGYPAYPIAVLPAPVEWRIPLALVIDMNHWIESWARLPNMHWADVLGDSSWIWPWMARTLPELRLALIGAAVGLLAGLAGWWRGAPFAVRAILLLAPWLTGLLVWLGTAPDERFARGPIWITYAGLLAFGWCASTHRRSTRSAPLLDIAIGLLVLALAIPVQGPLQMMRLPQGMTIQTAEAESYTTPAGTRINIAPVCWATPLPCTPYKRPSLRQRRPDDLASGYVLDDPFDCINLHSCRPVGVRTPTDVGFDLPHRGWQRFLPEEGRRWMNSTGDIVLYVETPRRVTIRLHTAGIDPANHRREIEFSMAGASLGRSAIAVGRAVAVEDLPLQVGFNVVSLQVLGAPPPGETPDAAVAFSLIEIEDSATL